MAFKLKTLVFIYLLTFAAPVIGLADGIPDSVGGTQEEGKSYQSPKDGPGDLLGKGKKEDLRPQDPVKKSPPYSLSDQNLIKYQYCGKDSDCIQVVNGCCQCMQGDPITAINKKHISDFERRFNCANVKCPADSTTHRCMDGVVSCINLRCTYFPPE